LHSRTRFSGGDSFRQLLQNVKQLTLDAYNHQSYPFKELVDDLQLRRDMSRSALFDVMVVFTSGFTGKPKGVEQTHKMLYNLVMWDINGSGLNKETRHLQFSSFSFDSSLHDIYYALATGGEVHIISETLRQDLWSLKGYIVDRKITTLSMPYAAVKAMFSALSPPEFEGHYISEIISTGEQLYITGGFRTFLESNPSIRLHNLYGPSETHVVTGVSYCFADKQSALPSPEGLGLKTGVGYVVEKKVKYI
jgi:non-ribosomal peptide synthetase component F